MKLVSDYMLLNLTDHHTINTFSGHANELLLRVQESGFKRPGRITDREDDYR